MDDDDQQMGRILTRREALALLGAAGVTILAGCGPGQTAGTASRGATAAPRLNAEAETAVALEGNRAASAAAAEEVSTAAAANTRVAIPACVVRPEATEGPFYVDGNLVRSDIREDRAGVPLVLSFAVSQVGDGGCTALEGAELEIWHCDAEGAYSDVSGIGPDTEGHTWLRGSQTTGADGTATFTTIYPGSYPGRAVHIHFKVRPDADAVFTSQLYFPDDLSRQVFATNEPYSVKASTPDTLNSTDNVYQDLLLLNPTGDGEGYAATFPIGIDVSTLGSGESGQPGGDPPS